MTYTYYKAKSCTKFITTGDINPRIFEIEEYNFKNFQVSKILCEIATKKAEVFTNTTFDGREDNLALEIIEYHLTQYYIDLLHLIRGV